jgi:hypothetical protein
MSVSSKRAAGVKMDRRKMALDYALYLSSKSFNRAGFGDGKGISNQRWALARVIGREAKKNFRRV